MKETASSCLQQLTVGCATVSKNNSETEGWEITRANFSPCTHAVGPSSPAADSD